MVTLPGSKEITDTLADVLADYSIRPARMLEPSAGVGAVSYTHLDVYKRQTYNNGHLAMADPVAAARNFLNALERIPSCLLYTSRCV